MGFCPNCKYEYNPGIIRCPDCGVDLVTELADQKGVDASQTTLAEAGWSPIGVLTSTVYAEQLIEGLRNSGVPAEIVSAAGYFGTSGMMGDGSYNPAGGGYTILVEAGREIEADEIAEVILGEIWQKSRIAPPDDQ